MPVRPAVALAAPVTLEQFMARRPRDRATAPRPPALGPPTTQKPSCEATSRKRRRRTRRCWRLESATVEEKCMYEALEQRGHAATVKPYLVQ